MGLFIYATGPLHFFIIQLRAQKKSIALHPRHLRLVTQEESGGGPSCFDRENDPVHDSVYTKEMLSMQPQSLFDHENNL